MIDTIYLVRHGLRLDWDTDDWISVTGIPNDPPLNVLGITQSLEIAAYFKTLTVSKRPTAIFSSPSYRCLQTIQPTAQVLGLSVFTDHGLSEWWSTVKTDGTLYTCFPTAEDVLSFVSKVDPTWTSLTAPDRKGEMQQDLYDRCMRFSSGLLSKIESEATSEKHTHIILVGHVAPLIALIRVFLGNTSQPMRLGCSSITTLRKAVLGKWEAVSIGNGGHLEKGALNDWGFDAMGLV
ncbi:histidine phosphatase superfamily [Lyophyllum atratum]|nr:histidine phosphatase superfamily [Lyophyllum atratum]